MRKQYVRYRLIRESETTAQQPTRAITGHTSMYVGSSLSQDTLTDKQAINLLKIAGKVLLASATIAVKIAYSVLKTLGRPIGRWIRDCTNSAANSAADLVVGTLKGALKELIDQIFNLVKTLWRLAGKGISNVLTGLAAMCCALLSFFKNAITRTIKGKTDIAYASSLRLNNRAIKILDKSTDNPRKIRRILTEMIEKSKATCKSLYDLCIKNNVIKKNPQLAGMVGLSTILICGHLSSAE